MAASIVAQVGGSRNNGNDVTIALGAEIATDDVLIVSGGFSGGTATAPGVLGPGGFASVMATVNDDAIDYTTEWLRVGATPPASVLAAGSGNNADAVAYIVTAVRGIVDTGNPWETVQTSILGNGVPQAPSVITATDGAMVLAYAGADNFDTSKGTVTNFSFNVAAQSNDTDDFGMGGAASVIGTAGSIAPTAWSTWGAANYVGVTVGLEPAEEEAAAGRNASSFQLLDVG